MEVVRSDMIKVFVSYQDPESNCALVTCENVTMLTLQKIQRQMLSAARQATQTKANCLPEINFCKRVWNPYQCVSARY
jgi:hypothetical protein